MNPIRPLILCLSLALCGSAHAGQSAPQPTEQSQTSPIELAQNPLDLPGLGLDIRLPVGSTASSRRISREVFADVIGKDQLWRLTISTRSSADKELGAEKAADQILENLQASFGVSSSSDPNETIGTFARVLDPVSPITFKGGTAYRFFLFQPTPDEKAPNTVRGVAVIKVGPGQMLVWDMTAPESNYAQAKAAMDATLAAVTTRDANFEDIDRGISLKAGHELIMGMSPDRMRSVYDSFGERWYRLYQEATEDSPEQEIGYRRVRAWSGVRSDLGGSRAVSGKAGQTPGLLVQIEARTLGDTPPGGERIIYDSKGTYFMSDDMSQEAWKLVVVIKQGRKSTTYTEVGARDGFEELLVTTADPSGGGDTLKLEIKEDGYLPISAALILPSLLAETGATGDVAFYTYRSDASAVTFRHDSIRHDPDNPGGWIHKTSVSHDSPVIVKYVDPDGSILREELPGGRRWVRTSLQELSKIWRSKRLPMG
ncbi:MAG TPA: hypothetical protein ENJ00_07735 [Phycisphaerales bacterium]|nr:hypothetical protein [Phycisphaerales bacterium]